MEYEWMKIMTGTGMWVVGIIFAVSALIQSYLFYRLARGTGKRMQIKDSTMNNALKASFISSLGPAMGQFVGMTVLVLALGGAYAFAREAAGVGSIMYELIAAGMGAEAAGVELTREGMTVNALPIVLWVAALGSFGWVLFSGIFTRWLPKIKDWLGGGDAKRLGVVTAAMMVGAFSRMLANDGIAPLLKQGTLPPILASVSAGIVAAIWLKTADRLNRPNAKQYFLIGALIVGMVVGQLAELYIT